MKTSRFRFKYRKNASKLHKAVGEILRNNKSLGIQETYQEYPVSRVNKTYRNNRHHFDWVIPHIHLVIECHGEQHYRPVAFDGNAEKAISDFRSLKARDAKKKEAALSANFNYVEVSYSLLKKLDEDKLMELIEVGQEQLDRYNEEQEKSDDNRTLQLADKFKEEQKSKAKEARKHYLSSDRHKDELQKAREYRKKQYRRLKELKDGSR